MKSIIGARALGGPVRVELEARGHAAHSLPASIVEAKLGVRDRR